MTAHAHRHALPGTDEARSTGTTPITRVVEDDRHLVVIDFGDHDVLTVLAAAIADAGLMDEFAVLGRARNDARRHLALDTLRGEVSVRRALQVTLTPEQAAVVEGDLADATVEPARCARFDCTSYADEPGEFCPPCADAADEAWAGRRGA
jgi:hypothetical protein